MKIADISESFPRLRETEPTPPKKKADFDHAGHKKWQKSTQNPDKKEYNKWRNQAGIKTESPELDESPLVVSHPDAIQHAIAKTKQWLETVMDYEHDIEDLNQLGAVVGFHVVARGDGDKVMFENKEK